MDTAPWASERALAQWWKEGGGGENSFTPKMRCVHEDSPLSTITKHMWHGDARSQGLNDSTIIKHVKLADAGSQGLNNHTVTCLHLERHSSRVRWCGVTSHHRSLPPASWRCSHQPAVSWLCFNLQIHCHMDILVFYSSVFSMTGIVNTFVISWDLMYLEATPSSPAIISR